MSRGWLEQLCPHLNERIELKLSAHKLLLRTQPAAGFGSVHIPPSLSSRPPPCGFLLFEGFLSLHLPSLSHLALFLSLFPVSLLRFPPFHHHLDFTIPIPS